MMTGTQNERAASELMPAGHKGPQAGFPTGEKGTVMTDPVPGSWAIRREISQGCRRIPQMEQKSGSEWSGWVVISQLGSKGRAHS